MSSLAIGLISAGCIFGGALLGLLLQGLLPEHHLRDTSKDTVKVVAGMIATLSALVLGLLVGSAKSSFDATNTAITQSGAKIILLDRVLAAYGPETKDVREQLRRAVAAGIECSGPRKRTPGIGNDRFRAGKCDGDDSGETASTQADDRRPASVPLASGANQQRYAASPLAVDRAGAECAPVPFLVVLLFWLTMLFLSFGLFAPRNATVIIVLLIGAMSVSGAIFIILEMNHPLRGMIKVSSAPMRKALEHLGQ